jgi:hypothetical protein
VKFIEPVLDGGARAPEPGGQTFEGVPARGGLEGEAQPFLRAAVTGSAHQLPQPDLLRRG